MIKVGIVMPVLNSFQMAVDALASVRTKYDWEPYIIPNYRLNMSLSASWNLGTKTLLERWCDYILIINDDILFGPRTIDSLVEAYEAKQSNDCLMMTALNVRDIVGPDEIFEYIERENFSYDEHPDFAGFMITQNTIEKVGWFDENFIPAYFEDNDYHRRIILSGHKAFKYAGAPFYHYGSQTQNRNKDAPVVPPERFIENRDYYQYKWGGPLGMETTKTPFGVPDCDIKFWHHPK